MGFFSYNNNNETSFFNGWLFIHFGCTNGFFLNTIFFFTDSSQPKRPIKVFFFVILFQRKEKGHFLVIHRSVTLFCRLSHESWKYKEANLIALNACLRYYQDTQDTQIFIYVSIINGRLMKLFTWYLNHNNSLCSSGPWFWLATGDSKDVNQLIVNKIICNDF